MTDGEQRIELQLEGFRSVVSGGFLALSQLLVKFMTSTNDKLERVAVAAERNADALELQNKLLAQRHNGHHEAEERTET